MSAVDADGARAETRVADEDGHGEARAIGTLARLRAPLSDPKDIYVPIRMPFQCETGDLLPDPYIRVRRFGRRNAPAVLVMGGISHGRNICGRDSWWSDIVGEGAAVDLSQHCVLGIDFAPLCDEHIALSPATQARLIALALDELGIERLPAIIGASYGGMVGLAFASLFPGRLASLCVISAAHRPSPVATALRGIQRRIVQFGIKNGRAADGLALARQLAMVTYRSPAEFAQRFNCLIAADGQCDLDRYLIARGDAYRDAMATRRWLSLSESIDRTCVAPEAISAPTTLVACPNDQLVPFADVAEVAKRLPRFVALHSLPSLYGHDAFLKEPERLGGILRSFLRTITP